MLYDHTCKIWGLSHMVSFQLINFHFLIMSTSWIRNPLHKPHGKTHNYHGTNSHPWHDTKPMTHHTHGMITTPMTHHTHTHMAKEETRTLQRKNWKEKEKNLIDKLRRKREFWEKKRARKWEKRMSRNQRKGKKKLIK